MYVMLLKYLIFQVSKDKLEEVLTNRYTFARGDSIVSPICVNEAHVVRDAFAKKLYGNIFVWIVKKINQAVCKPSVRF